MQILRLSYLCHKKFRTKNNPHVTLLLAGQKRLRDEKLDKKTNHPTLNRWYVTMTKWMSHTQQERSCPSRSYPPLLTAKIDDNGTSEYLHSERRTIHITFMQAQMIHKAVSFTCHDMTTMMDGPRQEHVQGTINRRRPHKWSSEQKLSFIIVIFGE